MTYNKWYTIGNEKQCGITENGEWQTMMDRNWEWWEKVGSR